MINKETAVSTDVNTKRIIDTLLAKIENANNAITESTSESEDIVTRENIIKYKKAIHGLVNEVANYAYNEGLAVTK